MTTTATPASNPELPIAFGAESRFRSASRLPSNLGFRPFSICVYSVFHPWPIELHSSDSIPNSARHFAPLRLSPFALIPRCLETPTNSTIKQFKDSRSTRQTSNIASYSRVFEAIRGYLTLFGGKIIRNWSKSNSPSRAAAATTGKTSSQTPGISTLFCPVLTLFNLIQGYSTLNIFFGHSPSPRRIADPADSNSR
jgi:hypothetical protein